MTPEHVQGCAGLRSAAKHESVLAICPVSRKFFFLIRLSDLPSTLSFRICPASVLSCRFYSFTMRFVGALDGK